MARRSRLEVKPITCSTIRILPSRLIRKVRLAWEETEMPRSALRKDFRLTDGATITLGGEAYNLFNHPNFAVPTNTQGPLSLGGNGDAEIGTAQRLSFDGWRDDHAWR